MGVAIVFGRCANKMFFVPRPRSLLKQPKRGSIQKDAMEVHQPGLTQCSRDNCIGQCAAEYDGRKAKSRCEIRKTHPQVSGAGEVWQGRNERG